MRPKVRAWVVFGGATKLGRGRAHLLRLVEREGSLKRAVEDLGMSYRAAWGYVRELEKASGIRLLARGGKGPSGGTVLTPEGRRFLAAFESFQSEVDAAADRAFRAAFAGVGTGAEAPPPSSPPGPPRRRRRKPGNA
jgi:molybdate transport system regulatory protein